MEMVLAWWEELSTLAQIMAFFAIPMTVVMLIQLILMVVGIGFEGDMDSDSNAYTDAGMGFVKIFTIRGIVAFFALGGWAGLAAISVGIHGFWAVKIALFVGVCALLLASLVIRLARKMQQSGNLDNANALGLTADVYMRIPPSRSQKGKVTLVFQERFVELDAVTDSEVELLPNTKAKVVDLLEGEDCVVVTPLVET
ncbi:MAG: hypothetical protein FWC13_10835 [Oscillospiraceae bacterium]|nr:hypothetical protein [Oscillospiraceae bacterium]